MLIRCGQLADDDYLELPEEGADAPAGANVIVPFGRWQKEGAALASRYAAVGVRIPNTADIAAVWPAISSRPLIELDFPAFGDGRAYSQAHLLRERFRFEGEIRARGAAVVRDQLQSMARSGIDSFVLRADQKAEQCLAALHDFDLAYQSGVPGERLPIVARLRRRAVHS